MENGIYAGLAKQLSLIQAFEVSANNAANLNTPAYKKDRVIFNGYLLNNTDNQICIPHNRATITNWERGGLINTDGPLDFALDSPSHFFALDTPAGVRYTKSGAFTLDENGTLISRHYNYPVLSREGAALVINPETNAGNFIVDRVGNVLNSNGTAIGSIAVYNLEGNLKKEGRNNFVTQEEAQIAFEGFTLFQGKLEDSNVSHIEESANMISINTEVKNLADTLNTIYQTLKSLLERLL